MKYRRLGRSGLEVSILCLGTMPFGEYTPDDEAVRIIHGARDAGVNFIDTADAYTGGNSERVVGRAIREERGRWLLATKVGNPMPPSSPNRRGSSRIWLLQAVEESLARLGTHIDIYYLHRDDLPTPLEETVATLGDLVRAGKIRYWGVSNFRAYRMAEVIRLCDLMGVPRPVVCQPYYNAMNRMPEVEILPLCADHGLGVVPYSPLARGVLTGKYSGGVDPASRAGRKDKRMMETEFREESIAIARTIKAHAEKRGRTAVGFGVNWVLANPLVSSVIAGPRTESQWQGYLAAIDEPFDAEDEALLDRLVSPGHPSTPGYNDPVYPILGRPVKRG